MNRRKMNDNPPPTAYFGVVLCVKKKAERASPPFEPGTDVRVRLTDADIASGSVRFTLAD